MLTKNVILDKLKQIIDSELNQDIVSLDLVTDILVSGGAVTVDMEYVVPGDPLNDKFQKKVGEIVRGIKGVDSVSVRLKMRPKKTQSERHEVIFPLHKVENIIAVTSVKGGVGKSTVTAMLAKTFAKRGLKVGLLDADPSSCSISYLLDIPLRRVQSNDAEKLLPIELENGYLKVISPNLVLGDGPLAMRGEVAGGFVRRLLHETRWGELDFLLIDLPPKLGDISLAITQAVKLDGVIFVTDSRPLSISDMNRGILLMGKLGVPMLGLLENMTYPTPVREQGFKPHGKKMNISVCDRFGLDSLGEWPFISELTEDIDAPRAQAFAQKSVEKIMKVLRKNKLAPAHEPTFFFDECKLEITFSEGEVLSFLHKDLRSHCPCFDCERGALDKRSAQKNVASEIGPREINLVGEVGIHIVWNDGHKNSLYPYLFLRELHRNTLQESNVVAYAKNDAS